MKLLVYRDNGDKFLVSIERENGVTIFDIPCTLVNGVFQDDETNEVYGSSVFNVISLNNQEKRS